LRWGEWGKLPLHWANTLGVCRDTIDEWRHRHPEFSEAFNKAKLLGEQWELDQVEANPARLNLAKWKLSAYYRRSETVKQEIKSENKTTITHKLGVDFGDR